ncbi:MAG: hypothetical protein DYH08_15270 [Actinobacteria bacterium ATB1]|nr:hypothetical protein [Actinobacteria bacterium ATB1]
MAAITADSPLAVVAIVVMMLLGASIGITVMALLASEALRIIASQFGDRDTELVESADSQG